MQFMCNIFQISLKIIVFSENLSLIERFPLRLNACFDFPSLILLQSILYICSIN
jgi:hypothetical protein